VRGRCLADGARIWQLASDPLVIRRREIAVRLALGQASPLDAALLVESLLLALIGGGPGTGNSIKGCAGRRRMGPCGMPRIAEIGNDARGRLYDRRIVCGVLFFGLVRLARAKADLIQDSRKVRVARPVVCAVIDEESLVVCEWRFLLVLLVMQSCSSEVSLVQVQFKPASIRETF